MQVCRLHDAEDTHGGGWEFLENRRISTGSGAKFLQLAKDRIRWDPWLTPADRIGVGIGIGRENVRCHHTNAHGIRNNCEAMTTSSRSSVYYSFFRDYFSAAVVCHRFLLMSNEIF